MTTAPPSTMVSIEIDGQTVEVERGSMIINAADRIGAAIPRFCYHDKLPIAANCRMCLVDVEKSPKPMPACATPVMDGMKVYTQSRRALDAQRNVMEFLLINHPLDCPICDQGGECELQDVAMGYGRSVSRFTERKRVVPDENLGPLIATDMTRCIHCTRCVRFMTEIAGTTELGGMGRGEELQIGTYIGKSIESELSGNIIDICPVGALTNKPFRFRARPWELKAVPGLGYHDGLGSNLYLHVRRGRVLRAVPRENATINGPWLADRDRFSHCGLEAPDRLTMPQLRRGDDLVDTSWELAISRAAELLQAHRVQAVVRLHASTSNEESALWSRIAAHVGATVDPTPWRNNAAPAPAATPWPTPIAELGSARRVLLLGVDMRAELPLATAALRQVEAAGGDVVSIGPAQAASINLAASKVCADDALGRALASLAAGLGGFEGRSPPPGAATLLDRLSADAEDPALLETVARWLTGPAAGQSPEAADAGAGEPALPPLLMVGAALLGHADAVLMLELVDVIAEALDARVNFIWPGANALGIATTIAAADLPVNAALEVWYGLAPAMDLAPGKMPVDSVVLAFASFADPELGRRANALLPIALLPEMDGSLTNFDGLRQFAKAAVAPPGESRPGWRVLRALGGALGVPGFDFTDFAGAAALVGPAEQPASDEIRQPSSAASHGTRGENGDDSRAAACISCGIYQVDAVVRHSAPLQAHPLNGGRIDDAAIANDAADGGG